MAFVVSAKVGNRSVVASGSILSYGTEEITLVVNEQLSYVLKFEKTESKKLDVDAEQPNDKALVIKLLNFENPLGSSYWAVVGDMDGKPLRLDLFVHVIGEADKQQRLFNYTFSVVEAPNG